MHNSLKEKKLWELDIKPCNTRFPRPRCEKGYLHVMFSVFISMAVCFSTAVGV